MPFFSRTPEPEAEPVHVEQPVAEEAPRKHGLFSRGRDTSPSPSHRTSTTSNTSYTSTSFHTTPGAHDEPASHSIFRRSTDASNGSGHRGLLHRTFGNGNDVDVDPSIVQARERVMNAEQAERDADRALEEARRMVMEARDHVRRLELEAKEEARRAKIKQYHAREVSKRAKPLGRECYSMGSESQTGVVANFASQVTMRKRSKATLEASSPLRLYHTQQYTTVYIRYHTPFFSDYVLAGSFENAPES